MKLGTFVEGEMSPFWSLAWSSIGDVVTEPTEIVETRTDQGVQDLTETAGMLDFECNRGGGRLYALAVALFCIC